MHFKTKTALGFLLNTVLSCNPVHSLCNGVVFWGPCAFPERAGLCSVCSTLSARYFIQASTPPLSNSLTRSLALSHPCLPPCFFLPRCPPPPCLCSSISPLSSCVCPCVSESLKAVLKSCVHRNGSIHGLTPTPLCFFFCPCRNREGEAVLI